MSFPWALPDGLPPGRLVVPDPQYADASPVTEPVLWITDEPWPEPGPLWARLLAAHSDTGLWPLLLTALALPRNEPPGRPWLTGELSPVPSTQADEQDAGETLAEGWNLATGQGDEGFDFGADAIPAVPFRSWPGLAEAAPPGGDPDVRAAEIVTAPDGVWELTGRGDPPYIGLVRASDGAGAITAVGWMSQAGDPAEIAAVIRSWQERFGVRLCSLGMDKLGVSVAWPPLTAEHARRVAAEHYAFCAEIANITSFGEYADSLVGAPVWQFWWD